MIFALGFLVAFILLLIFNRPERRLCRWREHRDADLSTWRCVYCGAETQNPRGKPPQTCFRNNS
ncbi:hypothetical protein [Salipiger mucosus]|uniref:Uncharacterized protein n=1 Tax=Salipiger mucosus DSM 16094 TaxID=1123237 RepID=S9R0S9_9RHOB|nr:hypothetical protein [Salipiger mucosus]EPX85528.1 hypothetical protein Salmuc_04799 [Salipiger mucosus DSM 16094]